MLPPPLPMSHPVRLPSGKKNTHVMKCCKSTSSDLATTSQMIAWQLLETHRQNLNFTKLASVEVFWISSELKKKKKHSLQALLCVCTILAARLTWQGISAGTTKTWIYLLNQHPSHKLLFRLHLELILHVTQLNSCKCNYNAL